MVEIAPEIIEAAKARDARIAAVAQSIEVEALLREGAPLQLLLRELKRDADEAMAAFAEANPADTKEITGLQARVFRYQYTLRFFDLILKRGAVAEHSLRQEDEADREVQEG